MISWWFPSVLGVVLLALAWKYRQVPQDNSALLIGGLLIIIGDPVAREPLSPLLRLLGYEAYSVLSFAPAVAGVMFFVHAFMTRLGGRARALYIVLALLLLAQFITIFVFALLSYFHGA